MPEACFRMTPRTQLSTGSVGAVLALTGGRHSLGASVELDLRTKSEDDGGMG